MDKFKREYIEFGDEFMAEYQFPSNWNNQNYNQFVEYLMSLKDDEYREFHSSLVLNSKYEMMGIRVPMMRKIAKEIAKTNIEEFLKYARG